VVAAEVRSLARRSSQAAKEINQLITTSVQKVGDGTQQVESAGETIRRVVQAVTQVTELIQGITTATAEQSDDLASLNQSIGQIDHTTQQNAALVEEAAAAAESLAQQAEELQHMAGMFRLSDHARGNQRTALSSPRHAPPAPAQPRARLSAPTQSAPDDGGDWATF